MTYFENVNTLQFITVEEEGRIAEFRELARWREVTNQEEITKLLGGASAPEDGETAAKPRKRGRPRKTEETPDNGDTAHSEDDE